MFIDFLSLIFLVGCFLFLFVAGAIKKIFILSVVNCYFGTGFLDGELFGDLFSRRC